VTSYYGVTKVKLVSETNEEQLVSISAKVTQKEYDEIADFLKTSKYVSLSDFFRDAVRDKISKETPQPLVNLKK